MFVLDPQLAGDTILLASLPLSELLLMNDENYPWLILVPRREGLRELVELGEVDRQQFTLESNVVSRVLQKEFAAEKLNVAALGNVVSQLHIHHIARFANDACWPRPVWGVVEARPYPEQGLQYTAEKIRNGLDDRLKQQLEWHF